MIQAESATPRWRYAGSVCNTARTCPSLHPSTARSCATESGRRPITSSEYSRDRGKSLTSRCTAPTCALLGRRYAGGWNSVGKLCAPVHIAHSIGSLAQNIVFSLADSCGMRCAHPSALRLCRSHLIEQCRCWPSHRRALLIAVSYGYLLST